MEFSHLKDNKNETIFNTQCNFIDANKSLELKIVTLLINDPLQIKL